MLFPKERRSGSFDALHMRHMLDRKIICHSVLLEKERIQGVAKNLAIITCYILYIFHICLHYKISDTEGMTIEYHR